MIGTRIIVPQGAEIDADYRRGGRGLGNSFCDTLPPGCYIVDDFQRVDGGWDGEEIHLLLAHASWEDDEDPDSLVTYHSGKHLYAVKKSSLVVTIDLFETYKKPEIAT